MIYGRKNSGLQGFNPMGYNPEPTTADPMGPAEPADIEPTTRDDPRWPEVDNNVGIDEPAYNYAEPTDDSADDFKFWDKKAIIIAIIGAVIAIPLIVWAIWYFAIAPNRTSPTTPSATTATAAETATETSETTAPLTQFDAIINDMLQNGGGELGVQYVIGDDVDPKLDTSKTGNGAFNPGGIRTPEAMISWLKEKTPRGLTAIAEIKTATEASEGQIFEVANWFVLQALVDGKLTGNTGFVDGNLVSLGERDIKAGDIFLVFVNPDNLKMIYFRGACANPQGFTPQLNPPTAATPTPEPTKPPKPTPTLAPKDPSKDPAAKGNAPVGSGVNQDPGPGNYVAPTAAPTPPVESRVNPTPPSPTVPTAAPTAATTAAAPAATPTPTPVDVAVGDPTSVGTPAIPD